MKILIVNSKLWKMECEVFDTESQLMWEYGWVAGKGLGISKLKWRKDLHFRGQLLKWMFRRTWNLRFEGIWMRKMILVLTLKMIDFKISASWQTMSKAFSRSNTVAVVILKLNKWFQQDVKVMFCWVFWLQTVLFRIISPKNWEDWRTNIFWESERKFGLGTWMIGTIFQQSGKCWRENGHLSRSSLRWLFVIDFGVCTVFNFIWNSMAQGKGCPFSVIEWSRDYLGGSN